mgnify:CR=1 FL=1
MKPFPIFALLLFCLLIQEGCTGQLHSQDKIYNFKKQDPNGIGKWFLGREIAHVMGYQGIDWLERNSREEEENTSALLRNMNLQKNEVIADIGAGSGYHVFRIAPLVKKVYAVDIQEEMLQSINGKLTNVDYNNIETVHSADSSVYLPKNSIDKVLMVDVYHEFEFPYEMLKSIKQALKPDGEIFLIEYRGEDPSVPIKEVHKMTEKQAVKELKFAGFRLKKNVDNLPWQHCMIFIKE